MSLVDHSRGIKKGDDNKWYRFEEKRFLFEESILQSEIETSGEAGIFNTGSNDAEMECDTKLAEISIEPKTTKTASTMATIEPSTMEGVAMNVISFQDSRGKPRLVAKTQKQHRPSTSHEVTFYMTSINIEVVTTLTGTAIKVTGETTESAAKRSPPVQLPTPQGQFGNFNLPVVGDCSRTPFRKQSVFGVNTSTCVSPPPNVAPFGSQIFTLGTAPKETKKVVVAEPMEAKKVAPIKHKLQNGDVERFLANVEQSKNVTVQRVVPTIQPKVSSVTQSSEAVETIQMNKVTETTKVYIRDVAKQIGLARFTAFQDPHASDEDVSDDEVEVVDVCSEPDDHHGFLKKEKSSMKLCERCHVVSGRREDLFKSKNGILDICISCRRREEHCSCKNGCDRCSKRRYRR